MLLRSEAVAEAAASETTWAIESSKAVKAAVLPSGPSVVASSTASSQRPASSRATTSACRST